MEILPLSKRLLVYLEKRDLQEIFDKQKRLFENNPFHSGLHTEIMEPKHLRVYIFRLTRKYRVIFIYQGSCKVEIIDINDHYQ